MAWKCVHNHNLNFLQLQKTEPDIKLEPADANEDVRYDSSDTDYSDADDEDYVYEERKGKAKVIIDRHNTLIIHPVYKSFVLGENGKDFKSKGESGRRRRRR